MADCWTWKRTAATAETATARLPGATPSAKEATARWADGPAPAHSYSVPYITQHRTSCISDGELQRVAGGGEEVGLPVWAVAGCNSTATRHLAPR